MFEEAGSLEVKKKSSLHRTNSIFPYSVALFSLVQLSQKATFLLQTSSTESERLCTDVKAERDDNHVTSTL